MADVLKFPKPLLCSRCKKAIPKGSKYLNSRLPDGNTAPVCTTCMVKGGRDDAS